MNGKESVMEFNIIIGNPPYNNDLYLDFVQAGYEALKPDGVMVMITPAKWQAKSGTKNEAFRQNIVPHMKEIIYWPDCLDVFAIQEADGVCYYSIDKDKHNSVIIENKSAMKPCINSKEVRSITNRETLWNVGNNIVKKLGNYEQWHFKEIDYSNIKKFTVNVNKQMCVSTGASGCWDWDRSCIKDSWIGKGGVLFSADGLHLIEQPKLLSSKRPDVKASGTSKNVFTSDEPEEIKNFISWMYSKFVRFLLLINIGTLTFLTDESWRFVPDPGAFDHPFTDRELYEKYGLTDDEIAIIESVIKERK